MTAPQIRPIETSYHGCRFRSRTEARWAVFFDALGVAWEYEREGYALPSGRYLPDFWLPKQKCWVEIKGKAPTDREEQLLRELGEATDASAYLFWGAPADYTTGDYAIDNDGGYQEWPNWDNLYWPCIKGCAHGTFDFQYMGKTERIGCCTDGWTEYYAARADSLLVAGYIDARSARFGT